MKKTISILLIIGIACLSAGDTFDNYCKEHPTDKKCVPEALGGKDNIQKERKREKFDEYHGSDYDSRQYPSQDLDDPRTTL